MTKATVHGIIPWSASSTMSVARPGDPDRVRMADLLFEKNSELPLGDPNRKLKGRCVLLGNMVKIEGCQAAVFSETASNPATLGGGPRS